MKASAEHIRQKCAFTERRGFHLLLVPASSYRYQQRRNDNSLCERLIAFWREAALRLSSSAEDAATGETSFFKTRRRSDCKGPMTCWEKKRRFHYGQ